MKKSDFLRIVRFKESDLFKNMEVGQCFLEGESVLQQIIEKQVGDSITYYKVTGILDGTIQYVPIYDKLEEG